MKLAVAGLGVVGSTVSQVLQEKGYGVIDYDKYKNIGKTEDILNSDIVFLCLPTPYIENHGYDISSLIEICSFLSKHHYLGAVALKSTVTPGTTRILYERFGLKLVHNPEFLSSLTAVEDFRNQNHIVIGTNKMGSKDDIAIYSMYKNLWPYAQYTLATFEETECIKLFCNVFYATKIQLLTEFYLLSQKAGANFEIIKDGMIFNGWINKKHTIIPGPDGKLSFGNVCFPKDVAALNHFMDTVNSPNAIVDACITERNKMRKD